MITYPYIVHIGQFLDYSGKLRLVRLKKNEFVIEQEIFSFDSLGTQASTWKVARTIGTADFELLWVCQALAGENVQ